MQRQHPKGRHDPRRRHAKRDHVEKSDLYITTLCKLSKTRNVPLGCEVVRGITGIDG
jgi:hypothetical protein